MARIAGEILIGRPVEVVFDYVADQSNDSAYNPQTVEAEKITPRTAGERHPVPVGGGSGRARRGDADRVHRL